MKPKTLVLVKNTKIYPNMDNQVLGWKLYVTPLNLIVRKVNFYISTAFHLGRIQIQSVPMHLALQVKDMEK